MLQGFLVSQQTGRNVPRRRLSFKSRLGTILDRTEGVMRTAKSGMDERRTKILKRVSIQTKDTGKAVAAKSKHIMNESYHRARGKAKRVYQAGKTQAQQQTEVLAHEAKVGIEDRRARVVKCVSNYSHETKDIVMSKSKRVADESYQQLRATLTNTESKTSRAGQGRHPWKLLRGPFFFLRNQFREARPKVRVHLRRFKRFALVAVFTGAFGYGLGNAIPGLVKDAISSTDTAQGSHRPISSNKGHDE